VNQYFLLANGKIVTNDTQLSPQDEIQIMLKLLGGKGGFGSLLRAIGAQIEKTTNREACRDLSGRRLRDINEEKRLKTWLDKKKAEGMDEDAEEKFQKKIEKLLAKPKTEVADDEYLDSRKNLLDNVSDSVEQGLKKARECQTILSSVGLKRKVPESVGSCPVQNKRVKGALWIDEGISDGDSDSEDEGESSGC
jgi:Silencing defective 2 N-terminal ubiquitin domain